MAAPALAVITDKIRCSIICEYMAYMHQRLSDYRKQFSIGQNMKIMAKQLANEEVPNVDNVAVMR
jgi:hypothetical protein